MAAALVLAVAAGLLAGCRTPPALREIASLAQLVGTVHVFAGDRPAARAAAGMPLRARDRVVTGSDAWAFLVFADGPKVLVGQGAEFVIEEATDEDIFVLMRNAALGAKIGKTRGRRLTLRTPSATADLRPGECAFRLFVDAKTGASVWDVTEGELRLRDNFDKEVLVRAGHRVSADPRTGFGGRPPLPFPPTLQASARAVPEKAGKDGAARAGPSLQPPDPPQHPLLDAGADSAQASTGPVGGIAFPPLPEFDEVDAMLEGLDWTR